MVFAKVGRTWYAGSISARHPSRGGRFVYDVHTYAERMLENVPKSRLLLFTKEEFERMFARMKNWRRAGTARCASTMQPGNSIAIARVLRTELT